MNDHSIGHKLRALRKGQKLTQQDVAERAGITRASLSNYELDRRTPDLKTLQSLAAVFGVPLDFFGIATADEVLDLLARAQEIFKSDAISAEKKDDLYREIMRLYLSVR